MFVQHRRERPEEGRGESCDQCQVGDASLRREMLVGRRRMSSEDFGTVSGLDGHQFRGRICHGFKDNKRLNRRAQAVHLPDQFCSRSGAWKRGRCTLKDTKTPLNDPNSVVITKFEGPLSSVDLATQSLQRGQDFPFRFPGRRGERDPEGVVRIGYQASCVDVYGPPPDCNRLAGLGSMVTTADVYPAS
jgi:hypothetical protein